MADEMRSGFNRVETCSHSQLPSEASEERCQGEVRGRGKVVLVFFTCIWGHSDLTRIGKLDQWSPVRTVFKVSLEKS